MAEASSPRRKNLITVACPQDVDGLSALLGQTREQFVAQAIEQRILDLRAKAHSIVGSGGTSALGFTTPA